MFARGPEPLDAGRVDSTSGFTALRTALQAAARDGAPDRGQRLATLICREARRQNLRLAKVLALLGIAWRSLPEAPGASRDVLDRIQTLCAEELGRAPDPDGVSSA